MTTEPIVTRSMTIKEFKALKVQGLEKGKTPSQELMVLRDMPINSAVVFQHDCPNGSRCKLARIIGSERDKVKHEGRAYSMRHLSDTEMAVACFPRDTEERSG